jgi:molecular chaperone GrpE (heat shock protein)
MTEYQMIQRIKQLEEQVEMEIMVKKSEVQMNLNLKEHITKLEIQLQSVVDINNQYAEKLAKLQNYLRKLNGI